MRKILFTFLSICIAGISAAQTTHPVSFSGFTFVPDTVTIDEGDNVQWTLNATHNAREVSSATYLANGNTSNGGFNTPFGGGTVNFPTAGTFHYVCSSHNLSGMKGVVIVLPANSIEENESEFSVSAYPTKVSDLLTLNINQVENNEVEIFVVNILGEVVLTIPSTIYVTGNHKIGIDMSTFTSGAYFIKVVSGDKMKTLKVIK